MGGENKTKIVVCKSAIQKFLKTSLFVYEEIWASENYVFFFW